MASCPELDIDRVSRPTFHFAFFFEFLNWWRLANACSYEIQYGQYL